MKKIIIGMLILTMVLTLCACGNGGETAPGGSTENTEPVLPEKVEKNPLVSALSVFLEAKDLSYAKALTRAESAEDAQELLPLFDGIRADLSEAEAPLYEAITVAFEAQKNDDGNWSLSQEGKSGIITVDKSCSFSFEYGEEAERNTFVGRYDDASFTGTISRKVGDTGSYPILKMALKKDGESWSAQFWYTADSGMSYRLVRYRFSEDRFRCGIWMDAADPGNLPASDSDGFFKGAITELNYEEDRLTVKNDGEEYAL